MVRQRRSSVPANVQALLGRIAADDSTLTELHLSRDCRQIAENPVFVEMLLQSLRHNTRLHTLRLGSAAMSAPLLVQLGQELLQQHQVYAPSHRHRPSAETHLFLLSFFFLRSFFTLSHATPLLTTSHDTLDPVAAAPPTFGTWRQQRTQSLSHSSSSSSNPGPAAGVLALDLGDQSGLSPPAVKAFVDKHLSYTGLLALRLGGRPTPTLLKDAAQRLRENFGSLRARSRPAAAAAAAALLPSAQDMQHSLLQPTDGKRLYLFYLFLFIFI